MQLLCLHTQPAILFLIRHAPCSLQYSFGAAKAKADRVLGMEIRHTKVLLGSLHKHMEHDGYLLA